MISIGSHVSIRRGFFRAAQTAYAMGGSAFQYFPKNPRSLGVKDFDQVDAARCLAFCREKGLLSIAHTPYPVNLAADNEEQRFMTERSLLNDLAIAEACGSIGVVVHFGIYKGRDPLEGYRLILAMLNEVLEQWNGSAKLLIENQAGDHAPMGTTFEELTSIRALAKHPERIGFCLDTCHLFASGTWRAGEEALWVERAEAAGYFRSLAAVHLNDSLAENGARRDRHAAPGRGFIGEERLEWLLRLPVISGVPLVLETPEPAGFGHAEQIRFLRNLAMGERGK